MFSLPHCALCYRGWDLTDFKLSLRLHGRSSHERPKQPCHLNYVNALSHSIFGTKTLCYCLLIFSLSELQKSDRLLVAHTILMSFDHFRMQILKPQRFKCMQITIKLFFKICSFDCPERLSVLCELTEAGVGPFFFGGGPFFKREYVRELPLSREKGNYNPWIYKK